MKKLLGLTALAAVLVLSACGDGGESSDLAETSCTVNAAGQEMTFRLHSEDGDIESVEIEMRMALSELDLEADDVDLESEEFINEMAGADFEGDIELDGEYLVITQRGTAEELDFTGTVDEFVEGIVLIGGTCN